MRPLVHAFQRQHTPESLVEQLAGEPRVVLLRSGFFESLQARYSFVAARPFLTFKSFGSRCELTPHDSRVTQFQFGNPWHILDDLMARYELLDEIDSPFPLGGCFGYWGYDLKNFVEPKLPRTAVNDLELPDCAVGFYDSLVVFDHRLEKTLIISTGLQADGSRNEKVAKERFEFWRASLSGEMKRTLTPALSLSEREKGKVILHWASSEGAGTTGTKKNVLPLLLGGGEGGGEEVLSREIFSNLSRAEFISKVEQAQRYIFAGDIYQVNLSQRLTANWPWWREATDEPAREDARPTSKNPFGWEFFQRLSSVSPAPFSAYLDCGDFQIASSSPESFLRMSGSQIQTRPIKGTRPRSDDANRDAQLTYELQTSAKEMAELVMITDLLRNDLGKVCEYGSVQVPELVRLERFPQVQHLVSTVEGRLRNDVTHFAAFASSFPGGSITGAPKIRAMEIIDELEPVTRGPYTGAIGYLGFNRESQLSITIRTAVCREEKIYFHIGAGIVADSNSAAEYEETLAKARGFFVALEQTYRLSAAEDRRTPGRSREFR
jgi:para-aminobenzoate synthetase component 1